MQMLETYKYDCSLHYYSKQDGGGRFFGQVKGNTLAEIKRKARTQGRLINVNRRIVISDMNSEREFTINP